MGAMSDNALALWAIAAVVAVFVIGAQPTRERGEATPVLVAKQLIPAGTPVSQVQRMVVASRLSRGEIELEAISDVDELSARVTSRDVFPGAQLTASDFER